MFKSTLLRSLFLLDPLFSLFLLFGILVGMAQHVIADLFKAVIITWDPSGIGIESYEIVGQSKDRFTFSLSQREVHMRKVVVGTIGAVTLLLAGMTVGFGLAFAAPQPLTRADCQKAGMHWDDNANVCGGGGSAAGSAKMGKGEGTQNAPAETPSGAHTKKIEQPHRRNP
jgi:hypothetical protein